MLRARASVLSALACLGGLLVAVAPGAPAQAAVTVYPVPTSSAGLGRIVTAPNGDMWFVEEDAGKIGRITPQGTISEFNLPATTTGSVDGSVQDLDVAPDGAVWVTYDYGRKLLRYVPASNTGDIYGLGQYPYGGAVRVAPDGVAWTTMNFDDSGIARTVPGQAPVWPLNAPECEDVLGEAADGSMWCQGGGLQTLVRVNADAGGGTTYPLANEASYPQALAAGPTGSIWFTRNSGGTWFTSANRGFVGYLNAGDGSYVQWSTGSRSAPSDLVRGPDNQMWFTNVGAEPGIGHISANGVGVISKVGAYEPGSLTFGTDGAVWFTDPNANSIVRVTTDQLQTNDVDLGDGVTMTVPGGPVTADGGAAGALAKAKALRVRKNAFRVPVTCPATVTAGCQGRLSVETAKKVRKPGARKGAKAVRPLVRSVGYKVAAGKKAKVKVKLTRTGKALVRGRTKVRAELSVAGVQAPVASRTFTVKR